MGTISLAGEQTFPPSKEMRVLQGANRVLGASHLRE